MAIIPDGLGTTITFGTSGFTMEKVRITPPAVRGGEKIDLTHLGNTAWKTAVLRTLKDLDNFSFEGHYDPSKHTTAPVNTNELITITFPDGDTLAVYGGMTDFEVGEVVEGAKVMCTGTIAVTNRTSEGTETGPAYGA